MRENTAHLLNGDAGCGDESMPNAQGDFTDNGDVVLEKEVVVIGDGTVEAVLNGEHGGVHCGGVVGEPLEHLCGKNAGDESLWTEKSLDGEMAVGAGFPLDGDAQRRLLQAGKNSPGGCGNHCSVRGNYVHEAARPYLNRPRLRGQGIWRTTMLWTITIILIVLWAVGLVGGYTLGGWIHILIVLAIISLIFNLLAGRRAL